MTWYGKGPDENYIDRQSGYEVGVYQKDVEDFFVDYIKPQETGNRTDTRWVSVTNDNGVGLLAKAETPIEFSALYYTAEELTNVLHSYMLGEKDDVTLRLNQRQMGVGGDNSWGAKPFEKYLNPSEQVYEYTYTLKPIATADISASMAESKVVLPEGTRIDSGNDEEQGTNPGGSTGGTDTEQPGKPSKPNKPNKPDAKDPVKTGDDVNAVVSVTLGVAALVIILAGKKRRGI